MKLKLYFLIILLIGLSDLRNLRAQTNDIDLFYNQTWAAAWQSTGIPYYNSKGHICFPSDGVILARMEIFNFYFMPHPFSNRYHDQMLKFETDKIDLEIKLDNSRKHNRKMFFFGAGVGAVLIFVPTLIFLKN